MLSDMNSETEYNKNPFNFSHFNLSRVRLVLNGQELPESLENSQLHFDASDPKSMLNGLHW